MPSFGTADVQITADSSRFRSQLDRDLQRAGRDAGDSLADSIQRQLSRAGAQIGRRLSRDIQRALRSVRAEVRVTPDVRRFRAELQRQLRSLPAVPVPVTADTSRFRRELDRALRGIGPIVIPTIPAPGPGPDGDINRTAASMRRLGSIASSVGSIIASGLRFTTIAAGALAAAGAIGTLVGALAPAAGILAAFPAAILGAGAAMGALKLATLGVGEAFGAALTGSAEEFKKSLEGIPPAAQSAAREMRTLKGEFTELRTAVSGAFFGQIEGQIKATGQALSGPLRSGLTGIAAEWGKAASGALDYIASTDGVARVTQVLNGTKTALSGVSNLVKPLTETFLQMAGAVSEAFGPKIKGLIDGAADALKEFNQNGNAGERAVSWVEGAITVFKQIGDVVKPLVGIFMDFSGAVNAGGGGGLVGLATVLKTVRNAIQPLLPAVQTLSAAFAEGFQNLAPALEPLAAAFAAVLTSLAPLIPIAGQLAGILGQVAAAVVQVLAPLAPFIASMFVLIKVVKAVQVAILLFRTAWVLLNLAFAVSPIGLIITAIVALIAIIVLIATKTTWFQTAWKAMTAALVAAWNWVWGILQAGFQAFMNLLGVVGRFFSDTLPTFFSAAWSSIASIVSALVSGVVGFFTGMWDSVKSIVSSGINAVVGFFGGIWGSISGTLSNLVSSVARYFGNVMTGAKNAVSDGIDAVVGFFSGIWGRIKGFLGGLKDKVVGFFKNLIPDIDIPFLANGGIIGGPTVAVVGESGPEVVIPLTRPGRARELAQESGLMQLLGRGGGTTQITNNWNMHTNMSDPMTLAQHLQGQISRAAGV